MRFVHCGRRSRVVLVRAVAALLAVRRLRRRCPHGPARGGRVAAGPAAFAGAGRSGGREGQHVPHVVGRVPAQNGRRALAAAEVAEVVRRAPLPAHVLVQVRPAGAPTEQKASGPSLGQPVGRGPCPGTIARVLRTRPRGGCRGAATHRPRGAPRGRPQRQSPSAGTPCRGASPVARGARTAAWAARSTGERRRTRTAAGNSARPVLQQAPHQRSPLARTPYESSVRSVRQCMWIMDIFSHVASSALRMLARTSTTTGLVMSLRYSV